MRLPQPTRGIGWEQWGYLMGCTDVGTNKGWENWTDCMRVQVTMLDTWAQSGPAQTPKRPPWSAVWEHGSSGTQMTTALRSERSTPSHLASSFCLLKGPQSLFLFPLIHRVTWLWSSISVYRLWRAGRWTPGENNWGNWRMDWVPFRLRSWSVVIADSLHAKTRCKHRFYGIFSGVLESKGDTVWCL